MAVAECEPPASFLGASGVNCTFADRRRQIGTGQQAVAPHDDRLTQGGRQVVL